MRAGVAAVPRWVDNIASCSYRSVLADRYLYLPEPTMAAAVALKTETGRPQGSAATRRLRREGKVPGVVYGLGLDPVAVSVVWPELRAVLVTDAGLNALITLDVDGDKQLSIVKDIQRHPVRRDVMHVDFIRIDPNAELLVEVPLSVVGEARELIAANGMVDQVMFSLSVWSKPDSIPDELEVDISELMVGDAVKVENLVLPSGTRTEVDPEESIAIGTVTRSTLEAMAADEAAEAAAEAEGVEGAAPDGDGEGADSDGGGDDAGDSE